MPKSKETPEETVNKGNKEQVRVFYDAEQHDGLQWRVEVTKMGTLFE